MHETVLVVEDDEEASEFLETSLRSRGYHVVKARRADRAMELLRQQRPALMLLDLGLPGLSGWDLLRAVRRDADVKGVPVIVLSGQDPEHDASQVLYEGADDFVPKPVEPDILLARVEAHLRRSGWQGGGAVPEWLETSDRRLRLHPPSRLLEVRSGHEVKKRYDLTPKEFELLCLLIRREGEVLRRTLILDALWPVDREVYPRTIDKLIENLRRKLSPLGRRIETVSGIGYVLRPQA
jgi:DNA-binding response OmpR family regulator